jgi:hypothetical protein
MSAAGVLTSLKTPQAIHGPALGLRKTCIYGTPCHPPTVAAANEETPSAMESQLSVKNCKDYVIFCYYQVPQPTLQ